MSREHTPRTLSRRTLGKAALAALAAPPLLAACGDDSGSGGGDAKTLIVRSTPGGAFGKANMDAIFQPFMDQTGIEVVLIPDDTTVLAASVKAGSPKCDIVDIGEASFIALQAQDALEPLDYAKLTGFDRADLVEDGAQANYVARFVSAAVLAYRTDVFPAGNAFQSWADFFDVKRFPGARSVSDYSVNAQPPLEAMLLGAGVPPAQVYPIDLDKALAGLTSIRPSIKTLFASSTQATQLLQQKEIVAVPLANGQAQTLIDGGDPVGIVWNQAIRQRQCLGILKGSTKADLAHQLIDFALRPEVQAAFSSKIAYGPTNTKAFDTLAPDAVKKLPNNPEWADSGMERSEQWWSENASAVQEAWTAWKAS